MLRALSLALCLAILSSVGLAETEIPFRYENGFILVQAQLSGGNAPCTFLVDSGASATVLHTPTASRLKISLGPRERVSGVNAEAVAFQLPATQISFNGVKLEEADLAVDLSQAVSLCGRQIDGLLGAGFFSSRVVQIDYAAKKIRLLSAAPSEGERLPLRWQNGIFCAQLGVNGSQPRWTRLDTGCNDSLHWVVPRSREKRSRGNTIGFNNSQRDLTSATVQFGASELSGIETSLHPRPLFPGEAGLLGNGLLERYTVTVDGPGRALYLRH